MYNDVVLICPQSVLGGALTLLLKVVHLAIVPWRSAGTHVDAGFEQGFLLSSLR